MGKYKLKLCFGHGKRKEVQACSNSSCLLGKPGCDPPRAGFVNFQSLLHCYLGIVFFLPPIDNMHGVGLRPGILTTGHSTKHKLMSFSSTLAEVKITLNSGHRCRRAFLNIPMLLS
jgi:hypothetical protein